MPTPKTTTPKKPKAAKVAPPAPPVETQAMLQARLLAFKLADAQVRLQRATDAQDPDKMIAIMDEILQLEGQG